MLSSGVYGNEASAAVGAIVPLSLAGEEAVYPFGISLAVSPQHELL